VKMLEGVSMYKASCVLSTCGVAELFTELPEWSTLLYMIMSVRDSFQ
jgi:hypothetical protein